MVFSYLGWWELAIDPVGHVIPGHAAQDAQNKDRTPGHDGCHQEQPEKDFLFLGHVTSYLCRVVGQDQALDCQDSHEDPHDKHEVMLWGNHQLVFCDHNDDVQEEHNTVSECQCVDPSLNEKVEHDLLLFRL
jgi:hypothetical protein